MQRSETVLPSWQDGRIRRQRSNGKLNKLSQEDRLAHDWYRFVLSFPPHLVQDYLESFASLPASAYSIHFVVRAPLFLSARN